MCVTVLQWLSSCLQVQINRVRLPAMLFSVSLYHFFFVNATVFSFWPFFFFILAAEPAGHALGSIYILSRGFRKNSVKKRDQREKKNRFKETENSVAGSRTWFICTCKQLLDHCTTVAHMVLKINFVISKQFFAAIDAV